jgi:type I restriction enzyme S subunit
MEVMTGYKQTEAGVIPDEWEVSPLQETCRHTITYGIVQCGPHIPDGVPYIRVSDMDEPELTVDGMLRTSKSIASKFARSTVAEGDLVYALRGKLGEVRQVPAELAGANLTQGTARLSPNDRLVSDYFIWAMRDPRVTKQASLEAKGTTFREITLADLRKINILVPPKLEQTAIAKALSDMDALLASIDRLIAKKRNLKQAAMQQLLTSQTRLPGFSGEWANRQLGDVICEISDGGTPSTSDSSNFGGDVPWVVIDDIKQKITSTRTTLTEKGLQACAARRWPQGTLIVSTGATIGEVGILQVSAATKQGICGIIFDSLLATPDFMQYWFFNYKKLLLSKAQGSSIKEVRAPTLVTLSLSLPEIDEQNAISNVLSNMDTELTALEVRRNKTAALKQGMMQELLTGRTRLV